MCVYSSTLGLKLIHVSKRGQWSTWGSSEISLHGPLARYAKLRVTHAQGTPGTFSLPAQVTDPDMHHGTCVTHVPWCMLGSLTSGFLWSRWWGKRSRHSWCMRNPQFSVSGKRPIASGNDCHLYIECHYLNQCWHIIHWAKILLFIMKKSFKSWPKWRGLPSLVQIMACHQFYSGPNVTIQKLEPFWSKHEQCETNKK